MLVRDIHRNFKAILDKNANTIAFGGCPAFIPEEIDLWLNQAFKEVISNKFTGTNAKQEYFEASLKRIADIQPLVIKRPILTTDIVNPPTTGNWVTINNILDKPNTNDKYIAVIQAVITFTNSRSEQTRANVWITDHELANGYRMTYNNNPWVDTPVAEVEEDKMLIYVDKFSMLSPYAVEVLLLDTPPTIDYTQPDTDITVVAEHILFEVINRAVVLALENIESPRTESKIQLNTLQE